jgi:hypothetical protein
MRRGRRALKPLKRAASTPRRSVLGRHCRRPPHSCAVNRLRLCRPFPVDRRQPLKVNPGPPAPGLGRASRVYPPQRQALAAALPMHLTPHSDLWISETLVRWSSFLDARQHGPDIRIKAGKHHFVEQAVRLGCVEGSETQLPMVWVKCKNSNLNGYNSRQDRW